MSADLDRLYWGSENRRIRRLKIPSSSLKYPPDTKRVIHVSNEFWSAAATFHRKDGIWRCIQADSIIDWMKVVPFDRIKVELLKRGCSWKWLQSPRNGDGERARVSSTDERAGQGALQIQPSEDLTRDGVVAIRGEGWDGGNTPHLAGVVAGRSSLLTPVEARFDTLAPTAVG